MAGRRRGRRRGVPARACGALGPDSALRAELRGELRRYCWICGLLLLFVTPIGIAVSIVWGIGLARRYFALEAASRRARAGSPGGGGSTLPPAARARRVLPMRSAELRIEDLLDAAFAGRREAMARLGVALRHESEVEGPCWGDPERLQQALELLLDGALDVLAKSPPPRQLELEVGENLSGSAAWVRLRARAPGGHGGHDAAGGIDLSPVRRVAEAHSGTLEVHASDGLLELVLTLPRQRPGEAVTARRAWEASPPD